MPRAGRRVESPRWLWCLGRREGAEPGSASRPPPDPAWPPPRSAPFSTSSVPRGSARVTRSGPLLPPLLPPLLRHPRSRSSSPSSLPNFERWVSGGKWGRSGTSRLPGPTAADVCATRPLSMPRAGANAGVPGAFRGTWARAWVVSYRILTYKKRKEGRWRGMGREPSAFLLTGALLSFQREGYCLYREALERFQSRTP